MGWKFPLKLGGRDRTLDIEHQAMLDALAPGWDVNQGTEIWAETRAEALLVTMVWAINRRVANQFQAARMTDLLADFETACALRVEDGETLVERRARLAAKLRGVTGNALVNLTDAAKAALGANFVGVRIADPSQEIVYWPGINPGPPGYEWCTNRCIVAVHANRNGLDDDTFRRKCGALAELYDHVRPSWLTYQIGEGTGARFAFLAGKGITGLTFL